MGKDFSHKTLLGGRYLPTVNCGNPNEKALHFEKKKNKSADFNTDQFTITQKDQKCKKKKNKRKVMVHLSSIIL